MDTTPLPQEPETQGLFQRNRNLIKGIMISMLIMLLLIPTFFISNLIEERQSRNEEVKKEIANQWSKPQTLVGPVLVIPFMTSTIDNNKKTTYQKSFAYFMPDKLNINGKLLPEIKSRSIFKVPVYNSSIDIAGSFEQLDTKPLGIAPENLLLAEAKLVFGVSDFKGLQEQTQINWDGGIKNMNVGESYGVISNGNYNAPAIAREEEINAPQGLSVEVPLDASSFLKGHTFAMKLQIRGSEKIFFTPVGTTTKVSIHANWKDRDFKGNYLPDTHSLTDTGFAANWNIYRSTKPQQKFKLQDLDRTTFGVNLIQPLDNYGKTTRTIKYAILVIMLTFVVYFFIEVFQKKHVHAIQYVLIGFALCIFYTLVLSISEYTSFQNAYILSALATILLISLYTKSSFNSTRTAGIFGGFLALLYTFIFILIQLEDGALLVGSIGLFLILAAIMYFSRKLDWHK